MTDKRFLNAREVADIMGISVSTAYKIIRNLNDELKSNGYVTVSGKVSREYFENKAFLHLPGQHRE